MPAPDDVHLSATRYEIQPPGFVNLSEQPAETVRRAAVRKHDFGGG